MRTCVLCASSGGNGGIRRSCMPISTRSTPRSSSGTTPRFAAVRFSSAAASSSRRAMRPRPAGCDRRCRATRRGHSVPTRSSSGRGSRPTWRRVGRSSTSSTTPLRWSRGSRSTRPSSTLGGSAGSAVRRTTSHRRFDAASARRSVSPSRSAEHAASSSPRSPAPSASRTACSSSSREPNSTSCIRSRSVDSGGSVRSPRPSCTTQESRPSASWRPSGSGRCAASSGRVPDGTSSRCHSPRTRVGWRPADDAAQSVHNARSADVRSPRPTSRRPSPRSSNDWANGSERPNGSVGQSFCGCASTTSPAPPGPAPCWSPPTAPTSSWRRRAASSPTRCRSSANGDAPWSGCR